MLPLKSLLAIDNSTISFSPGEIIRLSVFVLQQFQSNETILGTGILADPFKFNSAHEFFDFALRINEFPTDSNSIYFKVGDRNIRLNTKNRYVCDFASGDLEIDDATLRIIFRKRAGDALSKEILDDRIKYAFLLKFFSIDTLTRLPKPKNPRSLINELINFVYSVDCKCHSIHSKENLQIIEHDNKFSIKFKTQESQPDGSRIDKYENIDFPFKTNATEAQTFIDNFFDGNGQCLSPWMGFFPIRDEKGPTYPDLGFPFGGLLEYSAMWQELSGQPDATSKNNLLVSSAMCDILTASPISEDSYQVSLNESGQTTRYIFPMTHHPLLNKEWFISYLPLVVASLFIAETARNPFTFLSNLILMDLIVKFNFDMLLNRIANDKNSSVALDQDLIINAMHFSWQNLLAVDANSSHKDIYGNTVIGVNWGGIHPMAHDGSFTDEFGDNKWNIRDPLTITRQKEADLLIRWLELKLKEPEIAVKVNAILTSGVSEDAQKQNLQTLIMDLVKERVATFGNSLQASPESIHCLRHSNPFRPRTPTPPPSQLAPAAT